MNAASLTFGVLAAILAMLGLLAFMHASSVSGTGGAGFLLLGFLMTMMAPSAGFYSVVCTSEVETQSLTFEPREPEGKGGPAEPSLVFRPLAPRAALRRPMKITALFRHPTLGLRCAYCHDHLGGASHGCPACLAVYHQECFAEARGCMTLGCVHQAKPRRVRA